MRQRREIVWVESDADYARSLSRFVRVHSKPVDLTFRVVARPELAWPLIPHADALIANPTTSEASFDLLASWQRAGRSPALAIAGHFDARTCLRLQRLKAVMVTKDGIFAEARQIARELYSSPVPPAAEPTSPLADPCAALLEQIRETGSTFADFVDRLEDCAIRRALDEEPSVQRAANRLGMRRSTLMSKMAKLGLTQRESQPLVEGEPEASA